MEFGGGHAVCVGTHLVLSFFAPLVLSPCGQTHAETLPEHFQNGAGFFRSLAAPSHSPGLVASAVEHSLILHSYKCKSAVYLASPQPWTPQDAPCG